MDSTNLNSEILKRSVPFTDLKDLTELIESIKNKKVVMLGESSHGTKEFYEWRSLISAQLIQHHHFDFVAVEGDWPPCQEVNAFIQHRKFGNSKSALAHFSRWPTWMWGNEEMIVFLDWLREWNSLSPKMTGFHGLDVYSLYESIDESLKCLGDFDPELAQKARTLYSCFEGFHHDEKAYIRSLFHYPEGCREKVAQALEAISKRAIEAPGDYFDVKQNARVIRNAESYYRATVFGEESSWNVRDQHMMETLEMLLDYYGPDAKGIVWAHNTHIGDYRATDMVLSGEINLGGLAREKLGKENVALVGLTTYTGEVIASHSWDGPIEVKEVPNGRPGSLEAHLHECVPAVGHWNFFVRFNEVQEGSPLLDFRGHRAIGVVYWPAQEHRGNFVPTSVARRYDALVFFDETSALRPLGMSFDRSKVPETWPYGTRL